MPAPDLIVTSAGPVRILPAAPPSLWDRILAFFHLGGAVANQPPTITSAEFTGGPYLDGSGATMTIAVTAQSLNKTSTSYAVPVVVGDAVVPGMTSSATATGAMEAFNQLAGGIKDPAGRTWTPGVPQFDPSTGDWTCNLTAEA